ncbi:putative cysteine synthase [Paracoccus phage vB_PmaS-R3]|uniref:Putative cysteine synthase n=1 Tax=Paracoccus phage vB_PmaS-R3 TaxID=2494563 RepID=A0A0B5A2I1_9CAUD|nr:putative cysteine synthase [Paracoccus phage vB_PmaS-R3]AJD83143.1 putative cysteine synthase [Paracoccus phage vB_PmaS-R3]
MTYRNPCGHCKGSGMLSGPLKLIRSVCPKCDGRGYFEVANVVSGPFVSRIDTQPDRILQGAIGQLQSVVVIGYDLDGAEYYASSIADGPNALWLIRRTEHKLIGIVDEPEER